MIEIFFSRTTIMFKGISFKRRQAYQIRTTYNLNSSSLSLSSKIGTIRFWIHSLHLDPYQPNT